MDIDYKKQGKKNKAIGKAFEKKVMEFYEKEGYVVMRFTKNVDLKLNKLINPKPRFNPFTKSIQYSKSGFPDLIIFKQSIEITNALGKIIRNYEIKGIECKGGNKTHKYLSKEEKLKALWYVKKKIFTEFLLAEKGEKRGQIKFIEIKDEV